MTYELKPDTKLRIYKGSDYFERTWLEVEYDVRIGSFDTPHWKVKSQLERRGEVEVYPFKITHPDAITEID